MNFSPSFFGGTLFVGSIRKDTICFQKISGSKEIEKEIENLQIARDRVASYLAIQPGSFILGYHNNFPTFKLFAILLRRDVTGRFYNKKIVWLTYYLDYT